jgi:hypothetical protein
VLILSITEVYESPSTSRGDVISAHNRRSIPIGLVRLRDCDAILRTIDTSEPFDVNALRDGYSSTWGFVVMSIGEMFSKAVYINLDRREDRRERMWARFQSLGMDGVERVAAVDGAVAELPAHWVGQEGNYGCLLSHKAAVASADDEGCESLVVFEDDVEFTPDFLPRLARTIHELPADWTFFYLGGSHRRAPVPVGDTFGRATYTLATFAYAVRRAAFSYFRLFDLATADPIDVRLARLQGQYTFHCALPNLAWLDSDYSDIQKSVTNHWYIKESLVIGDRVDAEMEGRLALIFPLALPSWRGADPAVVSLLIEHFREAIPGLIILEDHGSTFDLTPADRARRASCTLGDRVDILMVAGSPVFFSKGHLLGALQMCQKCGVVSPFNEVVPLSEKDVAHVLAGRRRRIDLTRYRRKPAGGSALHWGFYRRDVLLEENPRPGEPIAVAYEVSSFGLYLETRLGAPTAISA